MSTLEKIRTSQVSDIRTALPSRARYYGGEIDLEEPVLTRPRYSPAFEDEVKKDIESGNPDILPSGATMKMLGRANAAERLFAEDKVTYKVNAKGKLFLALYAVAVLSLILIIVLNALAIERQKQENLNISEQVAYLAGSVEDLRSESENVSDPSYIMDRAEELGMQQVESEVIKVTPPAKATQAEPKRGNWFDWLCDLFS